jgi:hypothetical protein
MKGIGKGKFDVISTNDSGLFLEGEIRDFGRVRVNGKKLLMVIRNNAPMQFFRFNKEKND